MLVVGDDEQPAPAVHVPATSPTADMHMSHRAGEERRTRTLAARGSAPPPAGRMRGPLRDVSRTRGEDQRLHRVEVE